MMLEHYSQTGYQVAVHVRRGDVGAEMPNSDKFKFDILSRSRRFAKDEVYLEVVRQVEARACLSCFIHVEGLPPPDHGPCELKLI